VISLGITFRIMASAAEDLREDEMNKDATPIQPTKSATQKWGRWGAPCYHDC